jgi:hypothetical protein
MDMNDIKAGMYIACNYKGFHKVEEVDQSGTVHYRTVADDTGRVKPSSPSGYCNPWTVETAEERIMSKIEKAKIEIARYEALLEKIKNDEL